MCCAQRRRLFQSITETCAAIDAKLGNTPGTAERGLYFWYWPPVPTISTEVLAALHADAVEFLHRITAGEQATDTPPTEISGSGDA